MTSTAFPSAHATRLRRATFVPSPADVAARRLYIGVSAAAALVSTVAIAVVTPLVF